MAFLLFLQQMNISHCASIAVTEIACNLQCISAIVVTIVSVFVTLTGITLGCCITCIGFFCRKRVLQNASQARANNQGRIVRVRIVANRNIPNPTTNTVTTVVANPVVAPKSDQPIGINNNMTNPETRPPVIPGYTYNVPNYDAAVNNTVLYPPTQTAPN